jgi:hypothetical protein
MEAALLQEKRSTIPGGIDMTKEEEFLRAVLSANDALVAVFKLYNSVEAAAKGQEEVTVTVHGGAEQTTDRTVRAFRPW